MTVMEPIIVLTVPGRLSESARDELRYRINRWSAAGRSTPLVLEEGAQLSVAGGLSVRIRFSDGPLDGLMVGVTVPALTALPSALGYFDGVYRPWLADDNGWMRTTDGNPLYRWEPATVQRADA